MKIDIRTPREKERAARWNRIVKAFDDIKAEHPTITMYRVCNLIATQEKMSWYTVRDILLRFGRYERSEPHIKASLKGWAKRKEA